MLNRRQLLSLPVLAAFPQMVNAAPQQPSIDTQKQIQAIYTYLDAFCTKQNVTLLIEGLIVSLDTEGFQKFDLSQEPTWKSIERLCPLVGFQLVPTDSAKVGYLIRDPESQDFFLQYTPKEMIQCIDRLLKKSPFQDSRNDRTFDSLIESLPRLVRASKPQPVKALSAAEQEQLYSILFTYFARNQSTSFRNLLHHLRSSLVSDCEFQWLDLFDTGSKVFGYRIRSVTSSTPTEVLLSHGFTSSLRGESNFNHGDSIFMIKSIDSHAPPLGDKLRVALKSLKYVEPEDNPFYIPPFYTDTLIKDLKLQNKEIDSDPQDIERCACVIGKPPEKGVILGFLKAAFDLKINASNGLEIITNKPASAYKSPYSQWLLTSAPGPISNFVQQHLKAKQANSMKKFDFNKTDQDSLKAFFLPSFPAHKLLAQSDSYIRSQVEKKLGKDEKLKVSEADYLVKVAFANRLLALFILDHGIDDFEVPGGLHTMFDSLYFKSTPEEGNVHLEFGIVEPTQQFVPYFSARKSGYGVNRPW